MNSEYDWPGKGDVEDRGPEKKYGVTWTIGGGGGKSLMVGGETQAISRGEGRQSRKDREECQRMDIGGKSCLTFQGTHKLGLHRRMQRLAKGEKGENIARKAPLGMGKEKNKCAPCGRKLSILRGER